MYHRGQSRYHEQGTTYNDHQSTKIDHLAMKVHRHEMGTQRYIFTEFSKFNCLFNKVISNLIFLTITHLSKNQPRMSNLNLKL